MKKLTLLLLFLFALSFSAYAQDGGCGVSFCSSGAWTSACIPGMTGDCCMDFGVDCGQQIGPGTLNCPGDCGCPGHSCGGAYDDAVVRKPNFTAIPVSMKEKLLAHGPPQGVDSPCFDCCNGTVAQCITCALTGSCLVQKSQKIIGEQKLIADNLNCPGDAGCPGRDPSPPPYNPCNDPNVQQTTDGIPCQVIGTRGEDLKQ